MAYNLKMNDSGLSGNVIHSWTVPIVLDKLTVKEIIKIRVEREVEKYNETTAGYFNGLIQPKEAESTKEGFRLKEKRKIDTKEQVEKAIKGFEENSFLVLINDSQVDNLDEVIELTENTEISFVKMIPLVGG
ncbi:MAG: hypothetical protein KDK36_08650 [Leptospiraceae bacterium]|nr:hypothetical protein [Leptospiraceae bacterium]